MRQEKEHLQELYSRLMNNCLAFVGKGPRHLRDIYAAVQKEYPKLCDDDYMCSESCIMGNPRDPEWHHRVRTVLQDLKGHGVEKGSRRGLWVLS